MKEEKKENLKKSKKKSIIIIISIFIIILIAIAIYFIIPKDKNVVGNTIANIRNYGYVVTDEKYLYFMAPNDEGSALGIRKIDKNNLTGNSQMLIENNWEILSLNYMDEYLYFITMADPEDKSQEDKVDNKIHRMKTDGTEDTVINDNDFNNECYEIYVVKDKIYYIGTDECIYYMDLDGNNKTKLNDNASGFIGITEDYIFFNKITESEKDENNNTSVIDYETYMMNLDGSNEHAVIEGEKLYNISVVDGYIYYQSKNGYPSKVKIDGTENEMISDEVCYSMIVTEEGIFYLNYYQENGVNAGVGVYRMDLDGTNKTELTKLDSTSEVLCEFDNWLYFSDNDENEGRFEIVSKDGKQLITLYSLDLSVYDETDENTQDTNLISNDVQNSNEVSTNIVTNN